MKNKHVEESLKHWFRMRRYMRTKPEDFDIRALDMEYELGESTHSGHCALCQKYIEDMSCESCPLSMVNKGCGGHKSPWMKVEASKTPKDWLKTSKEMLKALWEVRNYEK